jgi:hypothetical protein
MKILRRSPIGLCLLFFYVGVAAQTPSPTVDQTLHVKKEITVGDILTVLTLAISLTGALLSLLISFHKDRLLRRKEYADRIRLAAGSVIAKLERWRELSLRYFGDIQPTIIDTSVRLIAKKDAVAARDFLWRNLVALRAQATLRIVDEEIEVAYSGLYGYDPNIHALYVASVRQLKIIDDDIYQRLLVDAQADVLELGKKLPNLHSATLGNALRKTCEDLAEESDKNLTGVIDDFRKVLIKLIEADDTAIVERQVDVSKE